MKQERNQPLKHPLPTNDEQPGFSPPPRDYRNGDPREDARAEFIDSPDFGVRFVRLLLDNGLEFPSTVNQPVVRQAYSFLRGDATRSTVMAEVFRLKESGEKIRRGLLKALLLVPSVSYEEIGALTNCTPESVRAYEQLFFNVRDRMDEKDYICRLVYPFPSFEMLSPDYPANMDIEIILLQAAWECGRDAALEIASCSGDYRNTEFMREMRPKLLQLAALANFCLSRVKEDVCWR